MSASLTTLVTPSAPVPPPVAQAAVILIKCGDRALFIQRGPGGDHPGEWCFPGGHLEPGESAVDAAIRETREECGSVPYSNPVEWTRRIDTVVDFTTFLAKTEDEFTPRLSYEHTAWTWAPIDNPPQPLHPGCAVALDRFGMDELGVARAMVAGELASPQHYENIWLFAIRITGVGLSYRRGLDEYVWRDPVLYLNDDFLARCNGLAVILEHPKGNALTTEEFRERIVGAIFIPYIKGEEVWGIAKIYDDACAELMRDRQLSTSPAVVFAQPKETNTRLKDDAGKVLLIEGKPSLLDHVAICDLGVWDKGGPPAGVDVKGVVMADGNTEGEKLDKVLSHLDSLRKRMDSMEEERQADRARMDAMERDDRARRDAEERERKDREEEKKKADRVRRDAARRDRFKHDGKMADAEYKAHCDAEEGKVREELEKEEGETAETAVDASRRMRMDAEEERRRDRARRDAEERERKDREEEEKRKADTARKDSEVSALRAEVDKLRSALPVQLTPEESAKYSAVQAEFDRVAQAFGDSAPRFLNGESLLAYKQRLTNTYKKHSSKWVGVDVFRVADDAVMDNIMREVVADSYNAALHPTGDAAGTLREVKKRDVTGRMISEFYGDPEACWGQFKSVSRALVGIQRQAA